MVCVFARSAHFVHECSSNLLPYQNGRTAVFADNCCLAFACKYLSYRRLMEKWHHVSTQNYSGVVYFARGVRLLKASAVWDLESPTHTHNGLLAVLARSLFSQVGSIRHTYDLWQWQSEIGNSNGLNPFKPCHQSNPSHPPTGRYILLGRLSLLCTGSNIAHLLKRIL